MLDKQRFDLKPMVYAEYLQLEKLSTIRDAATAAEAVLDIIKNPTVRTQEFDDRCLREFWSKNQDKLKVMQKNAIDPLVAIGQFRVFLDRWDDKKEWEAVIISDNVAYDCRMVNHYLSVAGLKSLSYDSVGKYRPNFDTDSYARGMEKTKYDNLWLSDDDIITKYKLNINKDAHDHFPENDAEVIYRLHLSLMENM